MLVLWPFSGYAIDFVKENDAGSMVTSHLEEKLNNEIVTLTIFYDYPFHLLARLEAETLKNMLLEAMALANRVLPVPGGPNSKIPFIAFRMPLKN